MYFILQTMGKIYKVEQIIVMLQSQDELPTVCHNLFAAS